MELFEKIHRELVHAEKAQLEGKAGLSRVCARRAAGLAVRAYLSSHGYSSHSENNFELMLQADPRSVLPVSIHNALDHLTMSVDLDHNLPAGINLIEDAKSIIRELT